jgi:hypothetical protein
LRDSFCGYLIPFLAERGSFTEFHWNHRLMAPLVLAQKPDLVVDEMAERHLYKYEPENAPEFSINKSGVGQGKNVLANFGGTFELKKVLVRSTKAGVLVSIKWRSLSEQVLDRKIALHFMTDAGASLATKEYDQDALGRTVPAFSEWTDTIQIPHANQPKITQLGVNLHSGSGISMDAVANKTDWGKGRVLLNLKDLENGNAH